MLAKTGVISAEDAAAIQGGLEAIEAEMAAGTFPFREEFEDRCPVETIQADPADERLRMRPGPVVGCRRLGPYALGDAR